MTPAATSKKKTPTINGGEDGAGADLGEVGAGAADGAVVGEDGEVGGDHHDFHTSMCEKSYLSLFREHSIKAVDKMAVIKDRQFYNTEVRARSLESPNAKTNKLA